MKIYPFKAVIPNLEKVPHTNDFFDTVKFRYHEYADEDLFHSTEEEGIYIYQIKDNAGQKYTGIVACTDIQDYYNGAIKKHEKTIASNELLQVELLNTRNAAIKPVLLAYQKIPQVDEIISNYMDTHKKLYVIEIGREKHRFWHVTEKDIIARIQQLFAENTKVAYIADGHHRSASFAALYEKRHDEATSKMLCAYFTPEQLKIDSFYRIVKDLNGLTADQFLEKLTELFKIKILKRGEMPYAKHEIIMLFEGNWFQLNWRKNELKDFPKDIILLDVHLLNEKVLKPILGVKNIQNDARVRYLEGDKTFSDFETATPTEGVGFCLFPIEFEDMKAIADTNGTMPPKSTFFEPRMKNGLLVYEL
jgi:uncharacterized protein (DUF1015 family)